MLNYEQRGFFTVRLPAPCSFHIEAIASRRLRLRGSLLTLALDSKAASSFSSSGRRDPSKSKAFSAVLSAEAATLPALLP